jgi:pimeloyl-ACP methyl ester carboxylesterase/DNA-binding CsgD family transcriptional regulator
MAARVPVTMALVGATRVEFCLTADGHRVAYAQDGSGRPLVMLPGWLSHVEQLWAHPAAASARAKLARSHRFIWYDRLGCGLSDRSGFIPSVDNDVDQLEAVLEAVGVERCSLIGYSWGGPVAATFTARYPERVDRLVLYSTYARGASVTTAERHESFTALLRSNWQLGTRMLGTIFIPNAGGRDLRWFSRFLRAAASADVAIMLLDAMRLHDVRSTLVRIAVPTLVLTNRYDPVIGAEHAREVASLVPGSVLHVLDGNEHEPFIRDSGDVVDVVLDFVDGRPLRPARRRAPSGAGLSPRETEVLRLLAGGATNKSIAKELAIKPATVERHVANVYRKLGASGRADAALAAAALGLVTLPGH